jgi:hypothetical protein
MQGPAGYGSARCPSISEGSHPEVPKSHQDDLGHLGTNEQYEVGFTPTRSAGKEGTSTRWEAGRGMTGGDGTGRHGRHDSRVERATQVIPKIPWAAHRNRLGVVSTFTICNAGVICTRGAGW